MEADGVRVAVFEMDALMEPERLLVPLTDTVREGVLVRVGVPVDVADEVTAAVMLPEPVPVPVGVPEAVWLLELLMDFVLDVVAAGDLVCVPVADAVGDTATHTVLVVRVQLVCTCCPKPQLLHVVQLPEFDAVEYMPAEQALQTRLTLAEHAVETYCPATHVRHVVHDAALVVVEKVPAAQLVHFLLAVLVHAVINVPATQAVVLHAPQTLPVQYVEPVVQQFDSAPEVPPQSQASAFVQMPFEGHHIGTVGEYPFAFFRQATQPVYAG